VTDQKYNYAWQLILFSTLHLANDDVNERTCATGSRGCRQTEGPDLNRVPSSHAFVCINSWTKWRSF